MAKNPKYYGKYRGYVADVNDPLKKGRIRVECPAITGGLTEWCLPCIPVSYDNGGDFHFPKVGEVVFIEFEDGDRKYPIYTGGYFSDNACPLPDYDPDTRVISWGDNVIFMEKEKMTITNGKGTVVLNKDDAELNVVGKVTVIGKSDVSITSDSKVNIQSEQGLNISAPNSEMNFDNGEMHFNSSLGNIDITDSGIKIESKTGSVIKTDGENVSITGSAIILTANSGSKSDSVTIDANLISKLKSL